MKRIILTLGLLAVLLAGCAPDPRRQADADATYMQAESDAEEDRQTREQDAQEHFIYINHWVTAAPFINAAIRASLIALTFTAFVVIASFGVGMSIVTIGAAWAIAKRNIKKPNIHHVRLDPVTRQYSGFLTQIRDGRYTWTHPNAGGVTFLDERNPNDKLLIQAMSAAQHAGALAHEARLSHRPDAIAQIKSPAIIDMESER